MWRTNSKSVSPLSPYTIIPSFALNFPNELVVMWWISHRSHKSQFQHQFSMKLSTLPLFCLIQINSRSCITALSFILQGRHHEFSNSLFLMLWIGSHCCQPMTVIFAFSQIDDNFLALKLLRFHNLNKKRNFPTNCWCLDVFVYAI